METEEAKDELIQEYCIGKMSNEEFKSELDKLYSRNPTCKESLTVQNPLDIKIDEESKRICKTCGISYSDRISSKTFCHNCIHEAPSLDELTEESLESDKEKIESINHYNKILSNTNKQIKAKIKELEEENRDIALKKQSEVDELRDKNNYDEYKLKEIEDALRLTYLIYIKNAADETAFHRKHERCRNYINELLTRQPN